MVCYSFINTGSKRYFKIHYIIIENKNVSCAPDIALAIKTRDTYRFLHIASEKLVFTLSIKCPAVIVKLSNKNSDYAAVATKKVWSVKDMKKDYDSISREND